MSIISLSLLLVLSILPRLIMLFYLLYLPALSQLSVCLTCDLTQNRNSRHIMYFMIISPKLFNYFSDQKNGKDNRLDDCADCL